MLPVIVGAQVRAALEDYLETTFRFSDRGLHRALFDYLSGPNGLFKGPYVDLKLPFRKAGEGETPPLDLAPPFRPYVHQLRAMTRLSSRDTTPAPTLVVTGTGSGKTECFLYPILDHCLRHAGEPGIKAIILYPMNALASDQARRIAQTIAGDPRLRGQVSAGLYIGGTGRVGAMTEDAVIDSRNVLKQSPPDILLTNYRMLDFLLLRPEDRTLWARNRPETLRYLVLDELHTYDGAQGSDVACLVRRLRERLAATDDAIAFVGTSATVGAQAHGDASAPLREFASALFGVEFDETTIVGEDRAESHEVFPPPETLLTDVPQDASLEDLDFRKHPTLESYVEAQAQLWFGKSLADPVALGDELARHALLRRILIAAVSGIQTLEQLTEDAASMFEPLGKLDPPRQLALVQSLLAMVARARRKDDAGRIEPLLAMQAQIWIRELRRLMRRVPHGDKDKGAPLEVAAFGWHDELDTQQDARFLPIVHCRACGVSGFGAVQKSDEAPLEGHPGRVGEAYLRRHKSARFLLPSVVSGGDLFPYFLCAGCLRLGESRRCACGRDDTLRVVISAKCSVAKDGKAKRFLRWCPACETNGSLRILGARAPSLSSVAATQLYASPFNEDKKLLAFTDSVQDAAHLAGFYGARTYRFAVRTALVGAVADRDGLPLSEAADAMLAWARKEASVPAVLAALVPSDLRDLTEVKRYAKKPTPRIEKELITKLRERLAWEATMEVGYNALVGRSLERCGSVAVYATETLLSKAVHVLSSELAETRPAAASSWNEASVRRFVEGLIYRLRTSGGVHHRFLAAYVENEGTAFHLSKRRNPLMSPYSPESVPFKFFTTRADHETFEPIRTDADQEAWVRDWAVRTLGLQKQDQGINLVYEALAKRLTQGGVFVALKTGKGTTFGLEPTALELTSRTSALACSVCRDDVLVAEHAQVTWTGMPCVRFRCSGNLSPVSTKDFTYYARLYQAKRIAHIATAEHTGLLTRPAREKLETRFKTGKDPFAPNLLVCTPTLEMGIDIGDLSATMLCSTPRAPASYVQRVGRAGRKTGNALVLSVAEARAHDLYFFTEPTAMMRGEVTPPGCFLDAPEILRRQVVAFAMDAWSRQASADDMIPRRTSFFFTTEGAAKIFPGRFLAFYVERHEELLSAFFARFGNRVSERSRARLTELAQPDEVRARIEGAFQGVREEHDELRRLRGRLDDRVEALKKEPVLTDELALEKRDAEVGRRVLHRMMGDIERKYPLNVLTDAGVLPNYAFPEPGVMLRSAIRSANKAKADGTGKRLGKVQTFEYLRPASSAIRELAPFSTFYADGRKVRITQIDVGTSAKPLLETWRFCRACAHSTSTMDAAPITDACPECSDSTWPDAGQLRRVVHMKRVSSVSDELASAVGDESEDREMVQYEVMDLVEIDDDGRLGARLVPDVPFGWELLTGVTLREINFGPRGNRPATLYVNGQAVQSGPFVVCADCGQVEEPLAAAKGLPMVHASFCGTRKGTVKEKKEEIFLYRSVQSEAIRVLLPVAVLNADRARASFQAALELGLRRKFRGNPTHILFKTMTEPLGAGTEGRRTFLVLYDGVPGGTGYLAELARDETLLDVLSLSLEALQSCSCKSDPDKDGCYRCLLAYQAQRDFDSISRQYAIELLSQVLAKRDTCEKRDTLSDVPMDSRVESELEALFLAKLAEWATTKFGHEAWQPTLAGGREAYLLSLPSARFRVELQVELGPAQGIEEWQRADFVIRPLGEASLPPICVYTDGRAYHVRPDQPTSELPDDLRKRRSLVESGRFAVFSLTWKDVHDDAVSSMWSAVSPAAFEKVLRGVGGSLPKDVHIEGSFSLLMMMLENPARGEWESLARALAVRLLPSTKFLSEAQIGEVRSALRGERGHEPLRLEGVEKAPGPVLGGGVSRPHANLLATWTRAAMSAKPPRYQDLELTLRLYDEHAERRSEDFEASWMAFLHAFNVLQWHPNLTVLTSSEVVPGGRPPRSTSMPSPPPAPTSALEETLAVSDGRYHALLRACVERELDLPSAMTDVPGVKGGVAASVDLFFERARVVISQDVTRRESAELAAADVLVVPHREGGEEAVIAILLERGAT